MLSALFPVDNFMFAVLQPKTNTVAICNQRGTAVLEECRCQLMIWVHVGSPRSRRDVVTPTDMMWSKVVYRFNYDQVFSMSFADLIWRHNGLMSPSPNGNTQSRMVSGSSCVFPFWLYFTWRPVMCWVNRLLGLGDWNYRYSWDRFTS